MTDMLKAMIVGWSIIWGMCILSFSIFQGGQLFMLFVIARDPWSIPVSFIAIWIFISLIIIGIPYGIRALYRNKLSFLKRKQTSDS